MAKDALGHGSDTRGGASAPQTEKQKDAEFVQQLRGWFAGDQGAAQALASKYGDKSMVVEFHRGTPQSPSPSGKAIPDKPASQSEQGRSSFTANNKQAGYKLALQEIHRRKK